MFKFISVASFIGSFAVLQLASAQVSSPSSVNTGIATALLNLEGAQVIPDVLPASSFNLSALLMQTFGSTSNTVGQMLSIDMAANQPSWSLQFSNNEANAIEGNRYTIMTLDPGAATGSPPSRIVRHYLANNVTLTNGQLKNTTQAIAGWFSPAPPPGSGIHRYATLIFEQPSTFKLPDSLSHRNATIETNFDVARYITQTGLGSVIAATYFQCENSTTASTTVSSVATSTVPSAAIQSAASSVSNSLVSLYGTPTSTGSSSGNGGAILLPSLHYIYAFSACLFAGLAMIY